jgi:hypothetical protein
MRCGRDGLFCEGNDFATVDAWTAQNTGKISNGSFYSCEVPRQDMLAELGCADVLSMLDRFPWHGMCLA